MCVLPAIVGSAFSKNVRGAVAGGLVGGLPGALVGSQFFKKKKRSGVITETGATSSAPTVGPSPSYGG